MITAREALRGLYAAARLFLFDKSAIAIFDSSVVGFWKSFSCAVIVLPGYVFLVAFSSSGPPLDIQPLRIFVIEGIGYIIGWTAWPLAAAYFTPLLNRQEAYIRYVVAYNWSTGPQVVILILLLTLHSMGILSDGLIIWVSIIVLFILLFYHGYIIRVALDVSVELAVCLVIAEFLIGQIIRLTSNSMLA